MVGVLEVYSLFSDTREVKKVLISTLLLLFAFPAFLGFADYEARENDSRLYTKFVQQLAEKPLSEFIALEWRGLSVYADPDNPYVRDHLIGQFIPSTLLAKLGWDGRYAHYLINQLYRFFIPLLMFFLFSRFFSSELSFAVIVATQVNSIALNYGLRANQEQALMFTLLMTMLGYFSLASLKGRLGLLCFGLYGFLVKGLVGLIQYPFWVLHGFLNKEKRRERVGWLFLLGVVCLVISLLYEWWFQSVTGYSFWEAYFRIQIFGRGKSGGVPFASLGYYIPRSLGYALPWTFGLYFLWKQRAEFNKEQRDFLSFILWNIGGYLLIFGLFSRTASRYIFPVYSLLASLGALGYALAFEKFRGLSRKVAPLTLHHLLFWSILLFQCGLFLYRGKTFTP